MHPRAPLFAMLALTLAPAGALAQAPPNIVVILADDMGWGDVGPYDHDNDPITPMVSNTPVLDQMATQGITLTEFYVSAPVCSPTRGALLTGRHSARMGITGPFNEGDPNGMDPSEITIAEALGAVGYRTGLVGKWHLGEQTQYLPTKQGFDEFYGPPYSNDMLPFYILRDETVVNANPDQALLTNDYTNEANLFITSAVNADKPFFLLVSHTMPHVPVYTSPAFTGFTGRGLYADCIAEIDWSVGEILTHLSNLGVASDTLVIFLSDNGHWDNTHGPEPWHPEPWRWVGGRADPLRGAKSTSYEGGVRVPFIAHFPNLIPFGFTTDAPANVMDLFTTLVTLGGGQIPTDRVIDGVDISPLLTFTGKRPADPNFFFYDVQGGNNQGVRKFEAMRVGNYKQHFAPNFVPTELYDLDVDVSESTPLNLPQKTAELKALALEFHCTLDDPPFLFPPSANIALGRPAAASSALQCETARRTVDGAKGTAWRSEVGENQWLTVDLGADVPIAWVGLSWGADYARHYRVQVSSDASSWTTVFGTANGNGRLDGVLVGTTARHVRLRCLESSAGAGYALRELQVLSSGMTGTTSARGSASSFP